MDLVWEMDQVENIYPCTRKRKRKSEPAKQKNIKDKKGYQENIVKDRSRTVMVLLCIKVIKHTKKG